MKYIPLMAFTCLLILSNVLYAQPTASARLDASSIKLGAQTSLHISVVTDAGDKVDMPVFTDTIQSKLLVVKSGIDTVYSKNDIKSKTVTRHVILTSFDPGTYTIPAYTINTSTGKITTQQLTLQVQGVQVDTTKAFYDIKQPIEVKYTVWDWIRDNWYWILIALLLISAIVWGIRVLKNRKKPNAVVAPLRPVIPEDILAINKLAELDNRNLWQSGEVKLYYVEISDIVREYLEKRYNIQAMEQTTDETLTSLRMVDLAKDEKARLRALLQLADLVKFARTQALPEENVQSMEHARTFILNTRRQAIHVSTDIKK